MKVSQFDERKGQDLDSKLRDAEYAIETLIQSISQSIYSKTNPDGFLTADLADYVKCLKLDKLSLERLYETDKRKLMAIVDKTRQEVENRLSEFSESLGSFNNDLSKSINPKMIKTANELQGVKKKLFQESKNYQLSFLDTLEALPKFEIDSAKDLCVKTEKLIYDLEGLVKIAEDACEGLKDALEFNFSSEENKEGLLV